MTYFLLTAITTFTFIYALEHYYRNQMVTITYNQNHAKEYFLFHDASKEEIQNSHEQFVDAGYGILGERYLIQGFFHRGELYYFLLFILLMFTSIIVYVYQHEKKYRSEISNLYQYIFTNHKNTVSLKIPEIQKLKEEIDRKANEYELQLEARKRDQQKQLEYYENIIHQMKATLSTTMLRTDLLIESDEQKEEHLYEIRKQTERANTLLQSLLSGEQVTTNTSAYQYTISSIYATVERSAANVIPFAQQKNITIDIQCLVDYDVAHEQLWFSEAIETILQNCISYANPNTAIEVKITGDDAMVYIELMDEGKDIHESIVEDVFIRYHSNLQDGHFGIGLHMAKEIIKLHFGELNVRNTPKGVNFCISIPLMKDENLLGFKF